MNFTDFNLDSGLQEGLAEAGYITCMPVQEQVLKHGLEGADLYVQSQTGTGKTAAYLVTILQRLANDPALSGKKALIMVPTRELAVQVEEEARIVGSGMKFSAHSFYGGVGYGHQQELLKKGVDIIIGTPGRVIDLQESGQMDLSQVAFLVVDEADRMFDMGFYPDLRTLIKVLPKAENRQTMLFSATLNNWVKNLAWEYTIEAKEITIEAENVTVNEIEQMLYHVSTSEKMQLLLGLIKKENPESLIVFCNTKKMSEIVSKRLKINGIESEFIIGDLPQSKRLQVIDSFKSGSLRCLVATDVAARGIDVDSLAMVINFDLPNEAENYVHRIGRTARAGKTGKAYSFCSEHDVYNLPAIEKYCEMKLPSTMPTDELIVEDKSAGVYIRTDRYDSDYDDEDDDRGRRGGRTGAPRGRTSRDGGRRPSDNRRTPGGRRSSATAHGGGDSKPARTGEYKGREQRLANDQDSRGPRNRGRRPEHAAPYAGAAREDNRDLSKLSFEERMAYYKSKYGSEEAARNAERKRESAASPKTASRGKTGNRQGTGPRGQRAENASGNRPGNRDTRDRSRVADAREGRKQDNRRPYEGAQRGKPGNRGATVPQGTTPAGIAKTTPMPQKKGIISLIKNLFGKKD